MTDAAMSTAWEAIIGWHGNLSDDEKEAITGRSLTELKESLAAVITARQALEKDAS